MNDVDLTPITQIVDDRGRSPDAVVPILQAIQDHYRYLPQTALQRVCELTEITPATITGVSTFYSCFRHQPVGRHIISICHGTACHVKGSGLIQDAVEQYLGLAPGEDTDRDRNFTIVPTACFGCCTLAPVIRVNEGNYGHLRSQDVAAVIKQSQQRQQAIPDRLHATVAPACGNSLGEIRVGLGSCCVAQGSGEVHDAISQMLARTGAASRRQRRGCVGMCHQTPLVEVVQRTANRRFIPKLSPSRRARSSSGTFSREEYSDAWATLFLDSWTGCIRMNPKRLSSASH